MPPKDSYVCNDADRPPYPSNSTSNQTETDQYSRPHSISTTNDAFDPYHKNTHAYKSMTTNRPSQQKPKNPDYGVQQPSRLFDHVLNEPSLDALLSGLHHQAPSNNMVADLDYFLQQAYHPQQQNHQPHQPQPLQSPQQQQAHPAYPAFLPSGSTNVPFASVTMPEFQYSNQQESNLDLLATPPFALSTNGSSNTGSDYNSSIMATPHSTLTESYFTPSSSDMVPVSMLPSSQNSPTSSTRSDINMSNSDIEHTANSPQPLRNAKQNSAASVSQTPEQPQQPQSTQPKAKLKSTALLLSPPSTTTTATTTTTGATTSATKPKSAKSCGMYKTHSYENVMTLSDFDVDSSVYTKANINKKKGSSTPQYHSSAASEPLDHNKVMEALKAKILRSNTIRQQTSSTASSSTTTSTASSSSPQSTSSPEPTVRPPNTYPSTGVLYFNLKNRRRKASVPRRASNKSTSSDGSNDTNSQ